LNGAPGRITSPTMSARALAASARVEPNLCLLGVRTHKTLFN